jgi:Ras GTPase-activating-like protein IQGAP2/3
VRQSKRYSVTALYLSMSSKDKELEIEDDLARGRPAAPTPSPLTSMLILPSPEDSPRAQGQDLVAVQEELRPGKGCALPRFADSPAHPESHGVGRGMRCASVLSTLETNYGQQNEVASHLEDGLELQEGFFPNDEKTQKYGNLLFLLQAEPRHIAHLCRLVSMAEIDALLQTVMFTIYGNQYESREEHLLLTMFQVRKVPS